MVSKENQLKKIDDVLKLTDSIINKKYLSFLTNGETYKLRSLTMNELAMSVEKHARIYHLKRFVYDLSENFLNKLITVVNVAYALKGTIITSIQSHGDVVDFYIGIVAKEEKGAAGRQNREALLSAFADTIAGNFSGSDMGEQIQGEELEQFKAAIDGKALCSISVVPSLRMEDRSGIGTYVQGIENLVDALKGRKYTFLTIADPVPPESLMDIRRGYENIYNHLLPLYKIVETKGTSDTISLSQTDTENYVKGITDGITRTQGKSQSVYSSNGFSAGVSGGISLGVMFGVQAGFNRSQGQGSAVTHSQSASHQTSHQMGKAHSETVGVGHAANESTQVSVENRTVKSILDKIEKNIERIDECEGYGAFHAAAYVIADDRETALNAAGNFVSLMKGERSAAQISAVNCWEQADKEGFGYRQEWKSENFQEILKCLRQLTHPEFQVNEQVAVSPCTMVSGPELTVELGFPKKSVSGLAVIPMHPFGRNIMGTEGESIELGQLYFMGKEENQKVTLNLDSLASHTFVAGSTGSGKSNAIYQILEQLQNKHISFMVVEPAKGEYKHIFGNQPDVAVLGTNEKRTELLKVNPFSFPEDIHVLEHIDRLIEIFNVCWPMYAAMPAILKEALEEAYISCGWDLDSSENRYGDKIFPSFSDLREALETVIKDSAYDAEVKSNYKGSLLTRVSSLTNGINGKIFTADELEEENLFDRNVIVDLSRVGSMETKSLIMGVLVMKLQEYRLCQEGINRRLHHVTVLEEAHHLLKRTSGEMNPDSSNITGKSVEMIANAIAEMRTYGEGFVIADQSPGLLDMAVIRNTNTKILLRIPEYHDRLLAGRAAGLNEGQMEELAKLPLGVAAVYQNHWLEPVLCRFARYEQNGTYQYKEKKRDISREKQARGEIAKWLIKSRVSGELSVDMEMIRQGIDRLPISTKSRLILKRNFLLQEEDYSADPWEGYKFDRLAWLVTEVLGCQKELVHTLRWADSAKQMEYVLENLLAHYMDGMLTERIRLEISHCLIKVYSKCGEEELRQYYEWDHEIRNRLM